MKQIWTEKHEPKQIEEFLGNSDLVSKVRQWADLWQKEKKQKAILLYGPTGCGKTLLSHLIAKKMEWEVFELNSSDFRSKNIIEKIAGAASQSASFSAKKRLVLIDEVDGLQARDRGGAGAIGQIMKNAQNPVILTANDIYADQKLAPLRTAAECLEFKKINYLSIQKRLYEICEKEGIKADREALKIVAKNSAGDMRSAFLDLQTLSLKGSIGMKDIESLGYRERGIKIFTSMGDLFHAKSLAEARKARYTSAIDSSMFVNWVEENLPGQIETKDLPVSYDWFSKGDVFEGRIMRKQYWGLKRYSIDLMTAAPVLMTEKKKGWNPFKFPQLLRKLSSTKGARANKKSISLKVGNKIHTSSKSVMNNEFFLLQEIFEWPDRAADLVELFGFEENEIIFLAGGKAKANKIFKILKAKESEKLKPKPESQEIEKPTPKEESKTENSKPEKGPKQTTLFG